MAKRESSDLRRWALLGAEHRLLQLAEEVAAIHRAFPELRGRGQVGATGRGTNALAVSGKRRRRRLSADARRRISEAQKKRWAKQKAGQGVRTGKRKVG